MPGAVVLSILAAAAFSPSAPALLASLCGDTLYAAARRSAPVLIAPPPEMVPAARLKRVQLPRKVAALPQRQGPKGARREGYKPGEGAVRLVIEARVAVNRGNASKAVEHARGGLELYQKERSPEWKLLRKLNQLLAALGDEGHLKAAHDVYEAMLQAGLRPTQVTFGTLIARAGTWRQPRTAVSYYREMLRRGIVPDAQTHNSLINAFVKAGDLGKACQVAASMAQRGVQPTLVTYNTLLDGCARAGNLTLARQTLAEMKRASIRPSERTYSIMIHMCAKRGHVDAAFQWFTRMEQNGIRPNVVSYTSLIDACAKAGQLERAFALLAEMELAASAVPGSSPRAVHHAQAPRHDAKSRTPAASSDPGAASKPNVVTYTSLIDACAKAGQLERAMSVFRQMIDAGVAPNDITCNALFAGCLQQGEVLLAREVLQYMTQTGLRPTAHSFTVLLTDATSGSAAFACLLRQMQTGQLTGGSPLAVPLVLTGTSSTDTEEDDDEGAAVAKGDLERELDADLASDLERAPQPFLADAAAPAAPELQRVFGIFGQMRQLGVPADRAAYNALINACARAGDVPRAEGAFGEMVAAGIAPDAISYSSLIKACAVAGDAERAEALFAEMEQRTNHFTTYTPPSSHTYAHLMAVHRRAGDLSRVLELLDEMTSRSSRVGSSSAPSGDGEGEGEGGDVGDDRLEPSVVHYSLALQACEKYKDLPDILPRAMRIYEAMRQQQLRLDSRGMLALSRICEAHGRDDLAKSLRRSRSIRTKASRDGWNGDLAHRNQPPTHLKPRRRRAPSSAVIHAPRRRAS